MRSVTVHLIGVTRDVVGAHLSKIADASGHEWNFPRGSESENVYIRFYDELEVEVEPEDRERLKACLGRLPDVSVIADISGRIPGDTEVRHFVEFMLGKFHGVAWDDYTMHGWTLAEIAAGHQVSGHPFFDYAGWHDESSVQRTLQQLQEKTAAPEDCVIANDEG